MSAIQTAEPLSPDQAQRLTDFARACKAAVRIVALYPATHPVIRSGLQRVAETSQRLRASGNATLTVFPDSILLDGHPPTRPDSALHELATLLHSHLIGELGLLGELPEEGWHAFLSLVARPPEEVRAEGGIGRAWMAVGGGPIEIRQIDYSEVLRERSGGSRRRMGSPDRELPGRRALRPRRCGDVGAVRYCRRSRVALRTSPNAWSRKRRKAAAAARKKSCCGSCRPLPITLHAPIPTNWTASFAKSRACCPN